MTPEELELKKYQARMSLWKTGIIGGTVAVLTGITSGIVSLVASYQEQTAKIELQKITSQHEMRLRQAKSDDAIMAKFMDFALSDDIATRLRFAHYLSIIVSSPEARQRWSEYHESVQKDRDKVLKKIEDLRKEKEQSLSQTDERLKVIEKKIENLQELNQTETIDTEIIQRAIIQSEIDDAE